MPSVTPTSTVTSREDDRPGWGYGDDNHTHTGPPGLNKGSDDQEDNDADNEQDKEDVNPAPTFAPPAATPVANQMPQNSRPRDGSDMREGRGAGRGKER